MSANEALLLAQAAELGRVKLSLEALSQTYSTLKELVEDHIDFYASQCDTCARWVLDEDICGACVACEDENVCEKCCSNHDVKK